jgi:hypothetical protein
MCHNGSRPKSSFKQTSDDTLKDFRMRLHWVMYLGCLILAALPNCIRGEDGPVSSVQEQRERFRTLFVTRSLDHERLIPYLTSARPDIVQIGNYGAMFHGYADNPKSTKTPMMLPVVGERAALEFQRKLNKTVHGLGLTVVGHFRLIKVMGDWETQSGFVDYYNNRWPEDLLGAKPHPDLSELLQRDAAGKPIQVSRYDNPQLTLCLSSPHARKMLKQMLKCAVDQGVDGVVTTYNYRFECVCPHCQDAFKTWLAEHQTPEQLKSKLGIDNLQEHKFATIPASIPGYPIAEEASELDWLAARWGAEHFKQKYDEIFLQYGRSLRKDFVVAQWNHLSHVSLKEERAFLPLEQWGRGEDYFWYSGGASFVGKNLALSERKAGDAWLSCLYIRELSGRKPFVMGKYDRIRLAVSMAEGYATGGLGMGRYMRFENPSGYETLVRYTNFMHKHRNLYDGARPWSDAAIILPRQTILNRRPAALDSFRHIGQALVERQLLLDVVVDENISKERLSQYRAVILPSAVVLSDTQLEILREYVANKGLLLYHGDLGSVTETGNPRESAHPEGRIANSIEVTDSLAKDAANSIYKRIRNAGATTFFGPWTLRTAAYMQPNRVVLHLVNYDRDETVDKSKSGPELERPIAAENVSIKIRLPNGRTATKITHHTPDQEESSQIDFKTPSPGYTTFTIPRIDVYSVITIE